MAAGRELLAHGVTPTVELAAERAGISRTTAYRYFTNRRALLVALHPEVEARSLLDDDAPDDPAARLEIVLERMGRQLLDHGPELRAALRLSLELPGPDPKTLALRQGRAIAWIEDALAPLRRRLGDEGLRRLTLAIRATAGIEAFVWLTDVGRLSPEDATELMRSSARTLLRAALT